MAASAEVINAAPPLAFGDNARLNSGGESIGRTSVPQAWQTTIDHNDHNDHNGFTAANLIISSPYAEPSHQLDLRTISPPAQRFALALTSMTAIRPDYATAPYATSFNWDSVVGELKRLSRDVDGKSSEKLDFYVIVFRSRLSSSANRDVLGTLDKAAHLEAVESGGLLKYWFGHPDKDGRNLATCRSSLAFRLHKTLADSELCLWRNREDARLGGAGSGHAAAMQAARHMYDEWVVERLRVNLGVNEASWSFSEWSDDAETSSPGPQEQRRSNEPASHE